MAGLVRCRGGATAPYIYKQQLVGFKAPRYTPYIIVIESEIGGDNRTDLELF